MMNSALAERAMQVFEDVFLLEEAERREAIARACAGDEALQREVEMLLENIQGIEIADPPPSDDPASSPFQATPETRYELRDEIGRGGMGVVYRAYDAQLSREVAVKVIRENSVGTESRQRFAAEAIISARLQHPGVPPVHDAGLLTDGRPYLAMKLVEGETFSSLLANRTELERDQSRFLAIFENICQGMAYAHSHDVIHRDLKPDNVIVGKFGEVQIMDWGLAKIVTAPDAQTAAADDPTGDDRSGSPFGSSQSPASYETRLGTVMGTPAYMPPEQTEGKRSKQTDVFSLGAILCEILTGHPPYRADSQAELINKSAKADLKEAHHRLDKSKSDNALISIAKSCLQSRVEDRPHDASEVADRISGYLQDVQTRLRNAETERARSEAKAIEEKKRRKLSAMLMATTLLLVIVVLGGWAILSQRNAQQARLDSDRRAAAVQRISNAQTEAIRLHQTAIEAPLNDLKTWESAQIAITQARKLLDSETPIDLANDINRLAETIESSLQDRKLKAKIERAREASLEQISDFGQPDQPEATKLSEQFQSVFDSTPISSASSDIDSAQAFIEDLDLPIQEVLIGAIDEWIVVNDSISKSQWLAKVISAVDQNNWRVDWRNALIHGDLESLLKFLDDDRTFDQSPRSVLNLCRSVEPNSTAAKLEETLNRISQAHMGDFWLNVKLGDYAFGRGDRGQTLQHLHHALAMRSLGSLHQKLGHAKLGYPRLNSEILEHAKRAIESNDLSANSWELYAISSFREGNLDDARDGYKKRFSLTSKPLFFSVANYINLLVTSNQKPEAIKYLGNLRDSGQLNWIMHGLMISLLVDEKRYTEAVEELERLPAWPEEQPQKGIRQRAEVAISAIKALNGLRLNGKQITSESRDRILRKAHRWVTQAWVAWETRLSGTDMLRWFVEHRNSGAYDMVYQQDSLNQLPNEIRVTWSNFWNNIQDAELRFERLKASTPEYRPWTAFHPAQITSESNELIRQSEEGEFSIKDVGPGNQVIQLRLKMESAEIKAIRFEFIANKSLEGTNQNRQDKGIFSLTELELFLVDGAPPDQSTDNLEFDRAEATTYSEQYPVSLAIDADTESAWKIVGTDISQAAIFHLKKPISINSGQELIVRLHCRFENEEENNPSFRLSYQTSENANQ